jgi:transcriptional regulator with XRE-family HTH domain
MEDGVKERLTAFLRSKGINNSEFGRRTGTSSAYVSSIRQSISTDVLEKIAQAFPDLNVEWLLLGTGEMYRSDTVTQNGRINLNFLLSVAEICCNIVTQNGRINLNGDGGNTVNGGETGELIELLRKRDEQIDRLISLLEKEHNNEHEED